MPTFVREALLERGLLEAYRERPPYQQNDYIGWITRAKRKETQERRLAQMVDELERGDAYMKMPYHPKRRLAPKKDKGGGPERDDRSEYGD